MPNNGRSTCVEGFHTRIFVLLRKVRKQKLKMMQSFELFLLAIFPGTSRDLVICIRLTSGLLENVLKEL